ncbi:MAG: UDP-N-acetylmuramate dehydrogenase, partial [Bacteroidota bacterium]
PGKSCRNSILLPGLMIQNQIKGREVVRETDDYVWLRIGAGENWHELVQYCIDQDWGGIENLSLIPGNVGAAPIQNIGAYGVELTDVFDSLEAMSLETGVIQTFSHADCDFGYRDSFFKRRGKGRYAITRVTLRLEKPPHQLELSYGAIAKEMAEKGLEPSIRSVSEVVCAIRRSKLPDPAEVGNAGSFFKNPVISVDHLRALQADHPDMPHYPQPDGRAKVPAAWLIQTAGWKGKSFGSYGVHPRQALVLVHYGGASGQQIYDLSEEILQSVGQQFDIWLEREVNIIDV